MIAQKNTRQGSNFIIICGCDGQHNSGLQIDRQLLKPAHPRGTRQSRRDRRGFPICVVPLLRQDIKAKDTPFWGYFCQISDSTTSYGSYSGAVPNEKITWSKLDVETPSFVIESDATIVAPLIFAYVLRLVNLYPNNSALKPLLWYILFSDEMNSISTGSSCESAIPSRKPAVKMAVA